MTYLTNADREALVMAFTEPDDDCAHNVAPLFAAVEAIVKRHVEPVEDYYKHAASSSYFKGQALNDAWEELDDLADVLDDSLEREKTLEDKLDKMADLARECQRLVSTYTRAHGENGDRVADLLSQDTYRIGTALLALLDE